MAWKSWVLIDFETASGADLKKTGAYSYAENPTTEVLCLGYSVQGAPAVVLGPDDLSPTGDLHALANDPEVLFVAHNAPFERAIWREIMHKVFGWPDIPVERWHCTMAVALSKGLPAKLEVLGKYVDLGGEKDMEGNKITLGMSKFNKKTGMLEWTNEKIERVKTYCAEDVNEEVPLFRFTKNFQGGERKVWELDQRINDRGIRLDTDYIHACKRLVDAELPGIVARFREITGVNPTQRDKFMGWMISQGIELPNLKKETVSRLLEDQDDDGEGSLAEDDADTGRVDDRVILPRQVVDALKLRGLGASAAIKKLPVMLSCQGSDGRARGLVQYHGAGPGRWAGRILQPHNFPRAGIAVDDKSTVSPDELVAAIMEGDAGYIRMLMGEPIECVTAGLRHCLVADQDKTLLIGDFAQIEARVVLAFAGQYDALELFLKGDPYCAMAEKIYKHPVTKKEHPEKRQTGKNTILACGFGMGDRTFNERYAPKETREFCRACIQAYRKDMAPKVPYLWYGLEEASAKALWDGRPVEYAGVTYRPEGPWLTALLPSGRKLWYFQPQKERRQMPWDPNDVRPGWSSLAYKQGRMVRRAMYGGLLTENVVQATARDLLVHTMFRCEAEGLPIVLTVHDENVVEDLDSRKSLFEDCMKDTPDWAKHMRIPIGIETMVSTRYRK